MTRRTGIAVKVGAAVAAVGLMMGMTAGPATAASIGGYKSCTSLLRVQSQTSGSAAWLIVAHTTNVIDGEWSYSGFHSSLSGVYASSWEAYTTHSISSASATCSGIS
jgi:hypothetical protein